MGSPSASESEYSATPKASDENLSSPCTPSTTDKVPGTLLSANTPATPSEGCTSGTSENSISASPSLTPCTASPVTTSNAGQGQPLKLPWTMSKAEMISFLTAENGVPPPANQRVSNYRDKVGMVMVNNMLDKLDPHQVTEILVRLHYDYDKHIARR